MEKILFGLDTFGDIPANENGELLSDAQALRQVVAEGVLADQLGVDIIALGEHHREDFAISSPEMVLAAMAMQTEKIKLSTGVTVLSSDDPVRVFQRFSTLDALSNGRAQVMLGRGSFTESFPLFGFNLNDYDVLFEEKLNLFSQLLTEKPVTWQGTTRAPLQNADVYPKTESGHLDTYVGVGGSPESIIRAARYGLPVMLAIIGGSPERFKPYMRLYEKATEQFQTPVHPVGMHSHGVIAPTDEEARELAWRSIRVSMDRIGRDRGWAPMTRERFENEIENGSYYVGSPTTVAKKIARTIKNLGVKRFDLVYSAGNQTVAEREQTIELYAKEVIPQVRAILAEAAND
ncbi:LLM class flavin-dependent oxidoreductase [Periweissella ghanensis]|uniref:Alkanal monooxygenase alpha chain n=1 Tax=Periweissella ghanensis TaxID=467997 RepID=A0ABM8ZDQ5_9LACO|nr:LLM class flavin-dependent oxidoreductase [Periweissella ghanensis]MCM0601394.1 LLM class flavin-dependent oxidoreductase [Periweissella ghanensis]CAH0419444.1 Alkanal monooxygenase alpha chain [Periweissella ghanensis]